MMSSGTATAACADACPLGDVRLNRHRDDARQCIDPVVIVATHVLDDNGHEGRREDPAEHEVVEQVGRVVGEVVGLGEGSGAEGVCHDTDAQESGEAAQSGTGGDDRTGTDEMMGRTRGGRLVGRAAHRLST
jgi:ribulose 1,5-bisphosphate synthetase/thiazole synthase